MALRQEKIKITIDLDRRGFIGGVEGMNQGLATMRNRLRLATGELQSMTNKVGMLAAAGVVAFGGITIAALRAWANLENLRLSFISLAAGITGSKEAGEKTLNMLLDFAAETPFFLEDIIETTKVMLAFRIATLGGGEAAGQLREDLMLMGIAARAAGRPMADVARVLGILRSGRFLGPELMPFAITREKLAEQGVKFTKAGGLASPEEGVKAERAAIAILKQMWGDYAEEMDNLLASRWLKLKGRINVILRELGEAIAPAVRPAIEKILELISSVRDAFRRLYADPEALAAFQKVFRDMADSAARFFGWLTSQIKEFTQHPEKLAAAFRKVANAVKILVAAWALMQFTVWAAQLAIVAMGFKMIIASTATWTKLLADLRAIIIAVNVAAGTGSVSAFYAMQVSGVAAFGAILAAAAVLGAYLWQLKSQIHALYRDTEAEYERGTAILVRAAAEEQAVRRAKRKLIEKDRKASEKAQAESLAIPVRQRGAFWRKKLEELGYYSSQEPGLPRPAPPPPPPPPPGGGGGGGGGGGDPLWAAKEAYSLAGAELNLAEKRATLGKGELQQALLAVDFQDRRVELAKSYVGTATTTLEVGEAEYELERRRLDLETLRQRRLEQEGKLEGRQNLLGKQGLDRLDLELQFLDARLALMRPEVEAHAEDFEWQEQLLSLEEDRVAKNREIAAEIKRQVDERIALAKVQSQERYGIAATRLRRERELWRLEKPRTAIETAWADIELAYSLLNEAKNARLDPAAIEELAADYKRAWAVYDRALLDAKLSTEQTWVDLATAFGASISSGAIARAIDIAFSVLQAQVAKMFSKLAESGAFGGGLGGKLFGGFFGGIVGGVIALGAEALGSAFKKGPKGGLAVEQIDTWNVQLEQRNLAFALAQSYLLSGRGVPQLGVETVTIQEPTWVRGDLGRQFEKQTTRLLTREQKRGRSYP